MSREALLDEEELARAGGFCARHGLRELLSWGLYECPLCERERLEACQCGGTGRCPGCLLLGGSWFVKCDPDCDTLCGVCCPDS